MRDPVETRAAGHRPVEALFSPVERWGWEFVFEGGPRPSPDAALAPQPEESPVLDEDWMRDRVRAARKRADKPASWGVFLSMIGAAVTANGEPVGLLILLAGLFVVAYAVYLYLMARAEVSEYRREWESTVASIAARHRSAYEVWSEAMQRHDEAERRRVEEYDLWYPVGPERSNARVEVFGGNADGWGTFLTTAGCSLLAAGKSITILDFSEGSVSLDLERLSAHQGYRVHRLEFPEELPSVDLLADLDRQVVAEVLSEAVHSLSDEQRESRELRSLDADLLSTVLRALDPPCTVARIWAAMRELIGHYRPEEGVLAEHERQRLTEEMVFLESTERIRDRVRMLRVHLDLLRDMGTAAQATLPHLPTDASLYVVARTEGWNERGNELLDALLFQVVRARLDAHRRAGWRQVLVVAGADRLGLRSLERMAKQASRAEVRLIYLFEHLRDDAKQLLGGGGATTVFMRLGNEQEAATAANHIGKGHSFVLSQITRSVGRTFTDTGGETWGGEEGESTSAGGKPSFGLFGRRYSDYTETVGTSRSSSWSRTRSLAEALSEQDGTTQVRSYEFTIEPTEIQSLPTTAFFLVEHTPVTERAVLADCNPGILALERVSDQARERRSEGP